MKEGQYLFWKYRHCSKVEPAHCLYLIFMVSGLFLSHSQLQFFLIKMMYYYL